ncbi:MAG: methyltransferase [Thermoleophilia bacterium]|nr:methyltransferase [Thermoleophilia bacterium]
MDASPAELAGFLAGGAELPQRALDLGCGTGADAVFLAEQGIETSGLDMSTTALALAKERAERHGVRIEWLQGDVLQLPLEDGCMDLVLDRGCLHHVAVSDQATYATEVARVLRPGGTLLVREMNVAGHHAHAVSESSLRSMVERTPLRVRSIVSYATAGSDRVHPTMLAVIDRD